MPRQSLLLWKIFKVYYCIKTLSAYCALTANTAFSMKSEYKPTGFPLTWTVLCLSLRLCPASRQNRMSRELLLDISCTEVLLLPLLCGKNSTTNPNSKLKIFLQSHCHGNKALFEWFINLDPEAHMLSSSTLWKMQNKGLFKYHHAACYLSSPKYEDNCMTLQEGRVAR